MGVAGQRHAPATLLPGTTRHPLNRRLRGPQGQFGRARKSSPPPEVNIRTREFTRWRLCRVCWVTLRARNWRRFMERVLFKSLLLWHISGVHILTHGFLYMSSNIILPFARRYSEVVSSLQDFRLSDLYYLSYLVGVSHASPISYSLIYVSTRLLPWRERGRFSERKQKYFFSFVGQQRWNILALLSVE
jgi:hypothetical protein